MRCLIRCLHFQGMVPYALFTQVPFIPASKTLLRFTWRLGNCMKQAPFPPIDFESCSPEAIVTQPKLPARVGVDQYCEYAGFLPRPEALRMQRDADLLLFLEFESPGVEGILTGKLFEYLAAGPQIWSVGVGSKSSAGCMINEYGRGRAFGKDVDAIREALLETVTINT